MKKFIRNIGIFVCLLVLVNVLLFDLGSDLYYKNYDSYSSDFDNYLFSDSYGTPLGKNPEDYNVYNFAVGGDSYIDINRKINFLIEKTKIDTLYLSAEEHMLSPYREQYNNTDRSLYYSTINDFTSQYEYYKSEVSQKIIYFQPKMGAVIRKYFVFNLEKLFGAENVVETHQMSSYSNWDKVPSDLKKTRINKRIATQYDYNNRSNVLEEGLLGIIKTCKTNNIVLIGVKFPITKEYYNITKDKGFGVETIFKENNIRILNFKTIFVDKGHLFYNEDHLNSEGGKLFTDILFNKSQIFKND